MPTNPPGEIRAVDLDTIDTVPLTQIPALIGALEAATARCWVRLGVERPRSGRARQWLRVSEAASEFGIAPATLYDWSYKRKVVTKKVGTAKSSPLLFWRPDLEKRARIRPALRARLDVQ
jgi:hypothetical protein